jgi:exosortase
MIRTPFFWASALVLTLASYVYYPVFFPPTDYSLGIRGEGFFFEANEAAGGPVLVLSLWLLYRRSHFRDLLRGPGSASTGLAAMVLSTAVFAWGVHTQAPDLELASAIVLLVGVVVLFGGAPALRAFWLPIFFLGFALPVSPVLLSAVMYPIQLATAEYAGVVLNLIGLPSVVQGDQILRPGNTFIVIETCSGIRTIVTLSMLTVLMIDLFGRRGWHVVVLLAFAPIVAFIVNGLRVVTLVLNPHSSIHSVHNIQGIAMLLVGLTAIYAIDGLLERLAGGHRPIEEERDYGLVNSNDSSARHGLVRMGLIASCLAMMLVSMRALPIWTAADRTLAERPVELLERVFGEDRSAPFGIDYNFIGSVRYLAKAHRRVDVDGSSVEIFLGVADEQERCYSVLTKRLAWPASGYDPVEEAYVEIVPGGPLVRRMLLRRGPRLVLSYSWVERRKGWFVEWFRQAAALDRSPFVRPDHMLAIRFSTNVDADGSRVAMAESERRIREIWELLRPELVEYASTREASGSPRATAGRSISGNEGATR